MRDDVILALIHEVQRLRALADLERVVETGRNLWAGGGVMASTVSITQVRTLRPRWVKPPLSSNARSGHWRPRADATRDARSVITLLANAAGLLKHLDHATVTVHYWPADRRGIRDPQNLGFDFKPVFDALCARGRGVSWPLVADDSPEHMTATVVQHDPICGEPAVVWVVVAWTETVSDMEEQP